MDIQYHEVIGTLQNNTRENPRAVDGRVSPTLQLAKSYVTFDDSIIPGHPSYLVIHSPLLIKDSRHSFFFKQKYSGKILTARHKRNHSKT